MTGVTIAEAEVILEENFADWVRELDVSVEHAGPDCLTLNVAFAAKLCRIGGIMCGQALVAAADTAMVIALASAQGGMKPMTTVDLTINYMRPIIDEDAVVKAKVVRLGKSLAFCTTEICGANSQKIAAFATGTYAMLG